MALVAAAIVVLLSSMGACYIMRKQDTSPSVVSAESLQGNEGGVDQEEKKDETKNVSAQRDTMPKATQIMPASSAAAATAASTNGQATRVRTAAAPMGTLQRIGGYPSNAIQGGAFAKPNAFAQGMMTGQGQQQEKQQRGAKKPAKRPGNRRGQGLGASSFPSKAFASAGLHGGNFQTCQARVGLWSRLEVKAGQVQKGELLGRGAYAEVYRGRAATGFDCAIKVYRSTASAKQLQEAQREIQLAASLDHPCTVRLLGWIRQPLSTITELCRGDLKAFYKDKVEGFAYTEPRALQLLKVGFGGINTLRSLGHHSPLLATLST